MSVAGIAASSFFSGALTQNSPRKFRQVEQDFQQFAHDLQSGNLTKAKTDFVTLQSDFKSLPTDVQQRAGGAHHHHHHSSGAGASGGQSSSIADLFSQLGQDLQTGNIAGAQWSYGSLLQGFQPSAAIGFDSGPAPSIGGVSVSA